MAQFKNLFLLVALFAVSSQAKWEHLRVSFKAIGGFNQLPRTVDELSEQGWVKLSSCADGNTNFPGDRWAQSRTDDDIVLIFDGNGFIAGMQTMVPIENAEDDKYYDFSTVPYYTKGDFFGQEVYYTTVYFVDHNIICNGGRSQIEFNNQGTGTVIEMQNGPRPTNNMEKIELKQADAIAGGEWYEHLCFNNMGWHFFQLDYKPLAPCNRITPFQVVYDLNGDLNGFVFQHVAALTSNRYETVNDFAITNIIDTPPNCLYALDETPGIKTLHTYVGTYDINCP